jgi:tetratricopeptide (TPR) repeat protein
MSQPSSLWERVKHARVFQVVAVYLGASWVVVQIAETLVEALSLPAWLTPVAIILLLVGLVVILATAWVQSLPSTTAREQTGELPGDWQIAPRDVFASLRQGRLPHLTWGRSLAGGVVMLSLLFGGAGMYVGLTKGGLSLGPAKASASEAAEGIAVVPFEVRGQDLEIWREGMMDLLANGLDGVGGFRTIDTRTLMARWNSLVGDATTADLDATLRVARAVGARFALEGSVVGLGANVRLVANVYDVDTGREVATGRAEGPAADVLRLADELAVATMRNLLAAIGRGSTAGFAAETITTTSLDAMAAFLEGERHYRKGRFAEAVQNYEQAIAADSTFAIALVRLSEAYGWLESMNSPRVIEIGERAMAQRHRLSPRYQFVMDGWDALNRVSAAGLESLKQAVAKYPDDPEAWFLLAETYLHVAGPTYATEEDVRVALEHATTLDPNFAPYLVHVVEQAILRGERELAEQTMARYEALSGNRDALEHAELAIPLLLGSEADRAAALDRAAQVPNTVLARYLGTFARLHDDFAADLAVNEIVAAAQGINATGTRAMFQLSMAQFEVAQTTVAEPAVTPAQRALFWAQANENWGVDAPAGSLDPARCDEPAFNSSCHLFIGVAAARLGRPADAQRSATRLREESRTIAEGDSALAVRLLAGADVVDGARVWRGGDLHRGRQLLERHFDMPAPFGLRARLELGWLETEAGRPAQAIRQFRSTLPAFTRPAALYALARTYEQLGQQDEALKWWTKLGALTENGDALPRVTEARAALGRAAREPAGR